MNLEEMHDEPKSLNELACRYADTIYRRVRSNGRGAIRVCSSILAVYGFDYEDRPQAESEIAEVRKCLSERSDSLSMRELGFGIDRSGMTWTILVRVEAGEDLEAFSALWNAVYHNREDDPEPVDGQGSAASQFLALAAVAFVAMLGSPDCPDPEPEPEPTGGPDSGSKLAAFMSLDDLINGLSSVRKIN